jgi:hypothetical protein
MDLIPYSVCFRLPETVMHGFELPLVAEHSTQRYPKGSLPPALSLEIKRVERI